MLKGILLIICFFLWGCLSQRAKDITVSAQFIRVVSGQTIEVMIPQLDNQSWRIRIIGIDAPKIEDTLWNEQIKTRLKELTTNRQLTLELESEQTDRYNRILAHIWHNDILVSEQLAKEGYVLANTKYPNKYSNRIFHAQEYARILGYGIWAKEVRNKQ